MKNLVLLCFIASAFGCSKAIDGTAADIQESAQQIGDVMASVDEVGGSTGSIASKSKGLENSIEKTFERFAPNELDGSYKTMIAQLLQPHANAASCAGAGFACNTGTRVLTRTFAACTVGTATFDGTVTATWAGGGTGCAMGPGATGDSITRVPNFTVTGRRGATLTVSKTGTVGQRLTWLSGTGTGKAFTFTNDGINRTFTANSTVLFNQTTTITTPITITGTDRANRVLSGGVLRVSNNVTSVNCDYAPTAVTWVTGCNCPTSGSWNGTCSNGKSSTLQITGCGTGTYSEGTDTQSISFDRCGVQFFLYDF